MKYLIMNTESFSPVGLKQKKELAYDDLPWVTRMFLSAFKKCGVVLDESSRIKSSQPMRESAKSSRTRLIKLLGKHAAYRLGLTGTLTSKSPVNAYDQYNFLFPDFFPESMWDFAENYCIMETLPIGRGRRIQITQKDYEAVRQRHIAAYKRSGELGISVAKEGVYKQYGISYPNQEHIIAHKKYSPFINEHDLHKRIAPHTLTVKREELFDVSFEKFVKEPIKVPVTITEEAKKVAKELIDVGFTDNLVLGKAQALELAIRLQDICNGFEPVKDENEKVTYKPFKENPKLNALMELLEEIDVEYNQVVIWSSRTALLRATGDALAAAGISYVVYDGSAKAEDKAQAEKDFEEQKVQVFLANQGSGAYGLNCLAGCNYAVYISIDGSVEKYHQSQHRILRGQLTAPKFAYALYIEKSIEEKQWEALRIGKELIDGNVGKEVFMFE